MYEDKKSKLVKKFHQGRMWLNVIQAGDGTELFTLNRSFRAQDGWVNSQFFQLDKGDAEAVQKLLAEYAEWRESKLSSTETRSDDSYPVVEHVVSCGGEVLPLSSPSCSSA